MGMWTHPCCETCFTDRTGRPPKHATRLRPDIRSEEECCFCGEWTDDGIYLRHEPMATCGTHN